MYIYAISAQFAGIFYIYLSDTLTPKTGPHAGETGKVNQAFCLVLALCTAAEVLLFRGKLLRLAARRGGGGDAPPTPTPRSVSNEGEEARRWAGTGFTPPVARLSQSLAA